jgi:CrcB protein
MPVLLVGLGGVGGVLTRYALTVWVQSIWTVVAINLVGSFLLGLLTHVGAHLTTDVRNALGVGFLGGFTTLSTLTVQTVVEADGGRSGLAATYFLVSVLGGVVCAALGYALGRALA